MEEANEELWPIKCFICHFNGQKMEKTASKTAVDLHTARQPRERLELAAPEAKGTLAALENVFYLKIN